MSKKLARPAAAPHASSHQPSQPRSTPLRATRMQFEPLEPRDMMAGPDEASSVMQASCMSAYFQQSALYEVHQPTSHPTVTWIEHLEYRPVDLQRESPLALVAGLGDLVDKELEEDTRRTGALTLPPGLGARSAGGIRRWRADRTWPAHVFAPYVDMSAPQPLDLMHAADAEGVLYFNLAYLTAGAQHQPCWNGDPARAVDGGAFDQSLRSQIEKLRASGGDVAVSFDGPRGKSLAEAITNVDQLRRTYRQVVDSYGLSRIDFDLSGAALDDRATIERRWQAVSALQRELAEEGQPLHVWVTLPATRTGLGTAAQDVVRAAGQQGVKLDGVNLKVAPAGDSNSGRPDDRSGRVAVETAINAYYELRADLPLAAGETLWSKIGITPELAPQPGSAAVFAPKDARETASFARAQGVGMVGLWSLSGERQSAGEPQSGQATEADSVIADVVRELSAILSD
ncbi:MAG: hypothetical protein AB7O59_09060 [Pirellulales bacterium]